MNTQSVCFQIWVTMPIKATVTNCNCALCTLHMGSIDPSGSLSRGLINTDAGLTQWAGLAMGTDADRSQSFEALRSVCIDNVDTDGYRYSRGRECEECLTNWIIGRLSGVPRSVCIGLHRQKITPYGYPLSHSTTIHKKDQIAL